MVGDNSHTIRMLVHQKMVQNKKRGNLIQTRPQSQNSSSPSAGNQLQHNHTLGMPSQSPHSR